MKSLTGKVAVVAGATRGAGRGIATALGEAGATEIRAQIDDPPTRTAVRTILSILEAKGHVAHRTVGRNYVYRATRTRQRVGRSALRRVLDVFFDGSLEKAVAAHLAEPGAKLGFMPLARPVWAVRTRSAPVPPIFTRRPR